MHHLAADTQAPHLRRLQGRVGAVCQIALSAPCIRRILAAAFAVVGIFALIALLLRASGSSGISFASIASACTRVENIHVTISRCDTGEVIYEMWISRELDVLVMRKGREHVVYDLDARCRRRTDLVSGQIETGPLNDRECAGVRRVMAMHPRSMLTDVPSDARWVHISSQDDQEVYEFTWTNWTTAGRAYQSRYEVAIGRVTRLPHRLRLFYSGLATTGWECKSQTQFEYPTKAQVQAQADL